MVGIDQSDTWEGFAMKRFVMFVFGVVVGVVVTLLLARQAPRRPPPPLDFTQPVQLQRGEEPHVYLVPFQVCADGQCESVREPDKATRWVVWYSAARVQVSYTEATDPPDPRR